MAGDAAWLAQVEEATLEPDLPIVDPHHHLWDHPGSRYLLDELLQDTGSGHNVVATVFMECAAMEPLRLTLKERPFLAGEAPAYADYCAFGGFMWARMTVGGVLEPGDPVEDWRQRMLDLFGGFARKAEGAED